MEKCKYKFQDDEKFDGKEYCLLFNEKCVNIDFVCDENCQVYEDYKLLQGLKAENERLKDGVKDLQNGNDSLYNALCKYKSCLQEIKEIIRENCKLCLDMDGFEKPDDCGICDYLKILQKIADCEVE